MQLLPLKGIKSYFALQAYGKMLLGLKMLPMYAKYDYHEFYSMIERMPESDQEKVIREGVFLGELTEDEVVCLARFVADDNGVPYTEENLKPLAPEQVLELLVLVCLECAKIKPRLLTKTEKKN